MHSQDDSWSYAYASLEPYTKIFGKDEMFAVAFRLVSMELIESVWVDVALELACELERKELDPS